MNIKELGRLVLAVLLSGCGFIAASELQSAFIADIDVGVSAPYLPAGARLVAVAVFGGAGAIGLFIGSLWLAPGVFPDTDAMSILLVAGISGFAPLLALAIVRRGFGIGEQLRELSLRSLLILIALMSVLSPLAHQLVFLLTGAAPASFYNLLAMIAGDVVGCMLVVLAVATVWRWFRPR